jgi:predicted dehydrogenase
MVGNITWNGKYGEGRGRKWEKKVAEGVDGVFVCTQDAMHVEVITGLVPLNLHILSEKPLATTLDDCLRIYASVLPHDRISPPTALFAVGHILRYSPHTVLLRKILLEDEIIGEITSIEHSEPVGWWHFSHSYVR